MKRVWNNIHSKNSRKQNSDCSVDMCCAHACMHSGATWRMFARLTLHMPHPPRCNSSQLMYSIQLHTLGKPASPRQDTLCNDPRWQAHQDRNTAPKHGSEFQKETGRKQAAHTLTHNTHNMT